MTLAVQIGRSKQRDGAYRAEGFRLHGTASDADPFAAAKRYSHTQARSAA